GSVSETISNNFFKEIERHIKKTGCRFVVDTAGSALKKIVNTGAYLIKPNLNEFSGLFGKKPLSYKQLVIKAKEIIKKGKIENILVSIGEDGAILVNNALAVQFIPPSVVVKSTVGAGDSMVAAIVYQLNKGAEIIDAVKFGVAAGSATTANSGMQLCSLAGAKKLLPKIKLKAL
ncbi:MAG: bifunctional hydroxymethylpyrimidine kinase/phosphomethylpyrimidine kinase, partial [Bacteroidia bacterium]|nr:bifunctional hydroxymethylpyrimidine kinase/phosphomethylpyrimidine kinase [Bacteroidia bacterium]